MVSMSAVWDRTTEFLSDNLGIVVPIALATIFVPLSIQANLQPLLPAAGPGLRLALSLANLLLSLVSLWGQLCLIVLAIDAGRGGAAPGVALRRLPAAIGALLVALVALGVLWSPVGVVLALGGVDFAAMAAGRMPDVPPATSTWLAVLIVVLVPLTIWLFARAGTLLMPVIVGERRALSGFARSFALTRGLGWRIVGVVLLYTIVSSVAILAARTVFGSILRLVAGDGGAGSVATVLTAVLVGVVATTFTVLRTTFCAKLYLAARDRRAAAETVFDTA